MKNIITIKNKLKKTNKQSLVLDIDGTLSWTIAAWIEQIQKKFGNPENLSVKQMVEKYHFTKNVPYYQTPKVLALMDRLQNSNKMQENLPLIKDSNKIVQKINKIIPVAAYLSARPETVIKGTKNWLKKYNFPQADIINRPDNIPPYQGREWKAKVIQLLYPEVLGTIDDNPELVEFLPKNYEGIIFLYNNTESLRNDINVIPCPAWKDVLKKIGDKFLSLNL